jgi:hypothetical protein
MSILRLNNIDVLYNHEFCTTELEHLRTYQRFQSKLNHYTIAVE